MQTRSRALTLCSSYLFVFSQAEDGIRAFHVTGVQTCALPISIFDQLPDSAKDDAQNDVVTLLVGKLQRAAGIPTIGVGRPGEDERWVAREKDTEPTDEQ